MSYLGYGMQWLTPWIGNQLDPRVPFGSRILISRRNVGCFRAADASN